MGQFLLRRLLLAIPTLIGISIVSFGIISLAPGDAAIAMFAPEEVASGGAGVERTREQLGLNDPLPVRYWNWMSRVVQGDLGRSLTDHRAVSDVLRHSAGLTLQLTVPALAIGLTLALALGLWTGSQPYSRLDNWVSAISITVASLPGFVIGLVALYVFAIRLDLLPAGGSRMVGTSNVSIFDRWQYFVLPLATLSMIEAAQLTRYVRDSVINVRAADYVQTARSKGLSDWIVMTRHMLRNAFLPIITITALQIPGLIAGSLLVEVVFGWGGLGSRVALAIGQRDFPVVMAATMAIGVMVVLANVIADVLYALADPRIRLA